MLGMIGVWSLEGLVDLLVGWVQKLGLSWVRLCSSGGQRNPIKCVPWLNVVLREKNRVRRKLLIVRSWSAAKYLLFVSSFSQHSVKSKSASIWRRCHNHAILGGRAWTLIFTLPVPGTSILWATHEDSFELTIPAIYTRFLFSSLTHPSERCTWPCYIWASLSKWWLLVLGSG